MNPNLLLTASIAFYTLATAIVFISLLNRRERLQSVALWIMSAGFVFHTVFIGTICSRTGHPPLTNLPETVTFMAWVIFVVKLLLYFRYRVRAAAFFVYPLILILQTIAALVGETAVGLDPSMRSLLFTTHLLLTTVGIAGLLVALAFTLLYQLQERALKSKRRGAMWDWIPSLRVCDLVSYRSLVAGFGIYTLGILAGIVWAFRSTASYQGVGAKEIGAVVAWIMFAALLQSYLNGSFRTTKTLVISAAAFASIIVSIFGIQHIGP